MFQKDLKTITKYKKLPTTKRWQSFQKYSYYYSQFQYSNLSMIKPNNTQLKTMQEAAQFMNFQKQTKKALKSICDDLGINDKLKKSDLMKKMPQELLRLVQQNTDHEVFRKHKILMEIIKKFNELNNRSQQMQQKPMMSQYNPYMFMQFMPQMMPQNPQQPFPMMYPPSMNMNMNMNMFAQSQGFRPQFQQNFNMGDFSQFFQPQADNKNTQLICPCRSQAFKCRDASPLQELKCIDCENFVHVQCLGMSSDRDKTTFECPQCVIQRLDPLHLVVKQMGRCIMNAEKLDGMKINFILNQEELSLIQNQGHSIEIRCIRLDIKYMYEITWPDAGELIINNNKVLEFKPLVLNSSLKKRKDDKYFTNDLSLISPSMNMVHLKENSLSNDAKQQYKISEDSVYYFGVFLVKQLNPLDLITKIKSDTELYKSKEDSIEQIRRQCLSENIDTNEREVSISSVTVSLKCQFDSSMIETPCRGRFCDHIQCLSLENMIHMTSSVNPRKWKCPICKQRTFQLIVDQYQKEIVDKFRKIGVQIREVTFDSEGIIFDEKQEKSLMNPSEDDSNLGDQKAPRQEISQQSKQAPQQDLIILDDEEVLENVEAQESLYIKPIEEEEEKLIKENLMQMEKNNEEQSQIGQNQIIQEDIIPVSEDALQESSAEKQQSVNKPSSQQQQSGSNPQINDQLHLIQQEAQLPSQIFEKLTELTQKQLAPSLQMPQLSTYDLSILMNNPQYLLASQQFYRDFQTKNQQSKMKDKEDHKNHDNQNAQLQYSNQVQSRIKEIVDKNVEKLNIKLQDLHEFLSDNQATQGINLTFSNFIHKNGLHKKTDLSLQIDNKYSFSKLVTDDSEEKLKKSTKDVEPNNQEHIEDDQIEAKKFVIEDGDRQQSFKIKIGLKQKEKIVKVLKKQYQEYIRKNFGTIDNPIVQQFHQQKLVSSTRGKNIYKISQLENMQKQQQSILYKQKLMFDQHKQTIKTKTDQLQINQQQNELQVNRIKQQQSLQSQQSLSNQKITFNPSIPYQQQSQLNPSLNGQYMAGMIQQFNQQKQELQGMNQFPMVQNNLLQQAQNIVNNNNQNNNNANIQQKAGVSDDPICIDDD